MADPETPYGETGAADIYAGPVKRSMTIAGHSTSISLEPPFWHALEGAARSRAIPLNALVARIDADRVDAGSAANLASVLRCWLLDQCLTPTRDSLRQ